MPRTQRTFLRLHGLAGAIAFAASAVLVISLAGCASSDPNERHDVVAPLAPPMDLDPTLEVELPHWFSNGAQSLEFADSGAYRMYEGTNRHAAPIEHGRWIRLNYAAVSLEPYAVGRASAPVRASLFKDGERLGLRIPKLPAMYALDGAPMSIEDELFGTWSGAGATLQLRPGMRFVFERAGAAQQPVTLAPVTGSWMVADGRVQLVPDSNVSAPMSLAINRTGKTVALESERGTLQRQ